MSATDPTPPDAEPTFDPGNPPEPARATQPDPNATPEGVDPNEWAQFRQFQDRENAATAAKESGSNSPMVEGALHDFDYTAAKERGGFYVDEVADSGDVTIGDVTVSRAALAVTDPEQSDAQRAQAAARIDLAVRGHVSWRDSRPVEEQIAMQDRPVISFPEGGD